MGEATTLKDAVLRLAQESGGRPFPSSAVADLGGWDRIAQDATTLTGHQALPLVAVLVSRDARPGSSAAAAVLAVADAVLATGQPALLRDALDALLESAVVTQTAGSRLVAGLESFVTGFLQRSEREQVADLASADALEAMTRLVAAGHGSHFSLLALLQKFTLPTVAPMARAVIRSVTTAVDVWPEADSLVGVVRALGGIDAVDGACPTLAAEVESDASWALATVSILRSLRAGSVQEMDPHLEAAAKFFSVAANVYARSDAAPMLTIVDALRELVGGVVSGQAMDAMATTALSAGSLASVREQVLRFNVDSSGLDHWYSDSKREVLTAWASLADDLEQMGGQLSKDGFYQAEVVVRNLLSVYTHARTFRVGTRCADIVGIQDLVQPVIEDGFARNASHLSNLEEYVHDLESQAAGDLSEAESARLQAARRIVEIARRVARGADSPGKVTSGAPYAPLPKVLGRLIPPGSPDEYLLAQISPQIIAEIEKRLDNSVAGRANLNLVQQELFDQLREALATSPDYTEPVSRTVDEILLLIINFTTSRVSSSASHYKYLFDPKAKEDAIHEDLYNFFVGYLGNRVEYEVSHTGGGRVDIRLKFEAFALHVEMKVDYTKLPMSNRTAYVKQAATYQGTDIRIGFLVALRHKAFDPTGPPPHIKTLIGHTAFDIVGDPEPRHIIHVAIPGSRTSPSDSK